MKPRLQIMKFGGTSVGDASCIARTAKIIAQAAKENPSVVVVSAMSGVTNRLIEAAKKAEAGNAEEASTIMDALWQQHESALTSLVQRDDDRARIRPRMEKVLAEGRRLCEGTALLRELTPRTLDAISSLGERLSAPLVAAAVKELGLQSEAIEATELIVTDAFHGGAEPQMELT
jgi:bifunctional aspartokinase / homoserine dehydrogenase 1